MRVKCQIFRFGNKKAVLSQGEPCDAVVNTVEFLQ